MPYYEVIYETGTMSVVQADSDEEVAQGLKEQHARARTGRQGGPTGHPAERVARVFRYSRHPGDFNPTGTLSTEQALEEVKALLPNLAQEGVVNVSDLAFATRFLAAPEKPDAAQNPHESHYRMEEDEELDSSLWENEE